MMPEVRGLVCQIDTRHPALGQGQVIWRHPGHPARGIANLRLAPLHDSPADKQPLWTVSRFGSIRIFYDSSMSRCTGEVM
jgi:hypothetical protein